MQKLRNFTVNTSIFRGLFGLKMKMAQFCLSPLHFVASAISETMMMIDDDDDDDDEDNFIRVTMGGGGDPHLATLEHHPTLEFPKIVAKVSNFLPPDVHFQVKSLKIFSVSGPNRLLYLVLGQFWTKFSLFEPKIRQNILAFSFNPTPPPFNPGFTPAIKILKWTIYSPPPARIWASCTV